MKSIKMALTAAAIFAVVGGALAFKTTTNTGGTFRCETTSQTTCTSPLKYSLASAPLGSELFCNDGAGGTSCTTSTRVVEDAK